MDTKFARRGSAGTWCSLIFGCMLTGSSLLSFLIGDDGFIWRGIYTPIWVDWILLPLGIGLTALSIYSLITNKDKPTYTDEEVAQAEAEMDAMYLSEHGELPDKSGLEKPEEKIE